MAYTNTVYIDTAAGGGGDGSIGSPYTWAEAYALGFSDDTEYKINAGSVVTLGGDYATGYIDLTSSSTGIKISKYGTGDNPVFNGLRDLSGKTWADQGGNVWRTTKDTLNIGWERVFFDKVGQGHVDYNNGGPPTATDRVYFDTTYLYIYTTTSPATGNIDGVATDIETPYDVELLNINGADNIVIENIDFYGARVVDTTLSANMTSIIFDGFNHYCGAMNQPGIDILGTASYNLSGFVFRNGRMDKAVQPNEEQDTANMGEMGTADGIKLRANVGPASGTTEGAGAHIHDSVINGWGHVGIYFSHPGVTAANHVRLRNVLIEDCTFDVVNCIHGRAITCNDTGSDANIGRRLLIKNQRSPCHLGSANSTWHNIIWDTLLHDPTKYTGSEVVGGAFDLFNPNNSPDPEGTATGISIHSFTILNATNAGIQMHTGGMNGGTGNTVKNGVLVDCGVSPSDSSHTGAAAGTAVVISMNAGSTQTAAEEIAWSNLVAFNTTAEPPVVRTPVVTTATWYDFASDSSNGYALVTSLSHWSTTYDTDPTINGTTYNNDGTGSAYNAGANVGVNYDYYNNPRPGAGAGSTAYDIGAVEYQDDSGGSIASATHTYSLRRKIATL